MFNGRTNSGLPILRGDNPVSPPLEDPLEYMSLGWRIIDYQDGLIPTGLTTTRFRLGLRASFLEETSQLLTIRRKIVGIPVDQS